jgi:hypothetical protein
MPLTTARATGPTSNISAENLEIAKGHKVVYFVSHGSATSENSSDNAVGRCGGYALTLPDGKLKMAGVCVRQTKDGDSWADEWAMEPGATRGTWKLVQGTGAFANKNWSGWWEPIVSEGKSVWVSGAVTASRAFADRTAGGLSTASALVSG